MCGRFEVLTLEEIEDAVEAVERRRANPRLDDAVSGCARKQALPGSMVVLLRQQSQEDGPLEVDEAKWGFDAPWGNQLVFNTRIESALGGSSMWKAPIQTGRCIIPAAAFFEAHVTERMLNHRTGRMGKRPYRFTMADGSPLLFAGVCNDGRCSIVTCEPNQWVSPVHPRMPLALRFEEVATWFGPGWKILANRDNIELVVRPEYPDDTDGRGEASEQLRLF